MAQERNAQRPEVAPDFAALHLWLAWSAVVIWVALVSWMLLTATPPGLRWLHVLSRMFASPAGARRVIQAILHLAIFGLGAVLAARAMAATRTSISPVRLFSVTLGAILVYGVTIELLQDRVPTRRADLMDLSGDLLGAALFLAIAWIARAGPFRRNARRPPPPTYTQ